MSDKIEQKATLTFEYTTDKVQNNKITADDILALKECIIIDYKVALEHIAIFRKLVDSIEKDCTVTIANIDKKSLENYRKAFNYIADGVNLIHHFGGIVKKFSFEKNQERKLIREILKDFKYMGHGCLVVKTSRWDEEVEICDFILYERLRLLATITVSLPDGSNGILDLSAII